MNHTSTEVSEEFLAELKYDLVCRRIGHGLELLEKNCDFLTDFNPETKNSALFLGYLAQWVDVGFRRPVLIKQLVSCYPKNLRARLPLHEYMLLRMAEGMVAM